MNAVLNVLKGNKLDSHDKYSFDHPPITSQADWDNMVYKALTEAEQFATLVEQLPEEKLWQNIAEEKHGNYYRNLHGIIEHTHHHLGQMVLIKKILHAPAEETAASQG